MKLFWLSLVVFVGLMLFPVFFVTFPWVIPHAYMAAVVASMMGVVLGICR